MKEYLNIKKFIRSTLDSAFFSLAKKSDLDNLYNQLSALMEVKEIIGPRLLLGPMRSWSLSPDALLIFLRDLTARTAPQVVEFGAGESTIAIAAALRAGGSGHLLS